MGGPRQAVRQDNRTKQWILRVLLHKTLQKLAQTTGIMDNPAPRPLNRKAQKKDQVPKYLAKRTGDKREMITAVQQRAQYPLLAFR